MEPARVSCSLVFALLAAAAPAAAQTPERTVLTVELGKHDLPEVPPWGLEIRVATDAPATLDAGSWFVYNETSRMQLSAGILGSPRGLGGLLARSFFDGLPTDRPGDHVQAVVFLHDAPGSRADPPPPVHVETAEVIIEPSRARAGSPLASMRNRYVASSLPLVASEGSSVRVDFLAPRGLTGYRLRGGFLRAAAGWPDRVPGLVPDEETLRSESSTDPVHEGTIEVTLDATIVSRIRERGFDYLVFEYRTVLDETTGASDWMHSGWIALEARR